MRKQKKSKKWMAFITTTFHEYLMIESRCNRNVTFKKHILNLISRCSERI